ncbi:MAG: T9SS type A sorting domain-containing protein [Calditrichaeota bacterium]|nr:T9SS type A sorting domain-containing protein [Calditrichota bacterium]
MSEPTFANNLSICRYKSCFSVFTTVILTCFIILTLPGDCIARILHVPDNFESIQIAIDDCQDRDTVIVSPGTYFENLTLSDNSITLASLFLITGDRVLIDSTIIDGGENGQSVVNIRDSQGRESLVSGLTITNGFSDYGGGIYIRHSAPRLEDLIIRNNTAQRNGGGVYNTEESETRLSNITFENNTANNGGGAVSIYQLSNIYINNCVIRSNHAELFGGGVQCSNATALIENVRIESNTSGQYGGAIHVFGLASVRLNGAELIGNQAILGGAIGVWNESLVSATFVLFAENTATFGGAVWIELGSFVANNSTFSGNQCEESGVIVLSGVSQVLFDTSILWNNTQPVVATIAAEGSLVDVNYSDIEGGRESFSFEGGDFQWGDGNITVDPMFTRIGDIENHLHEDSPCIDVGNPDAVQEEDGSRADMGAFPFFRGGALAGIVFSDDDELNEDARVTVSNGVFAMTDHDGSFRINNVRAADFSVTVSASGYADAIVPDLHVDQDEVLEIEILLNPLVFTPLLDRDVLEVDEDDSRVFRFIAGRNGNGVLEWNLSHRLGGEAGVDNWERSRIFPVGQQAQNSIIEAVAFVNDMFYVSANDPDGLDRIKVFNQEGEFVSEFDQVGNADAGITDFAWDGEVLWGSGERRIFGFSADGELIRSFDGPFEINHAIAWDSDRGAFWVGMNREDFIQVDSEGEIIGDLHNPGFEVTGLSYWDEAPDEYKLYITHHTGENRMVHKMNPVSGDTVIVCSIATPLGGECGGSFISPDFYQLSTVFMNVFHSTGEENGDRIDIFLMDAYLEWITYNPIEGILNPNTWLQVNIVLNPGPMEIGEYEAELIVNHNGADSPAVIPIACSVTNPQSAKYEAEATPETFGLSSPYPNPFNSHSIIKYSIEEPAFADIVVFNMEGRVVETQISKWHNTGSYELTFNAGGLSSGMYFVQLSTKDKIDTKKLIFLR